ncbi:MAG: hypothetical protein Q7R70_05985 [Candidatus Diapherotrites archaeon]|nr:hypothetical protein [Candidatus Diapherotrites archaeon]
MHAKQRFAERAVMLGINYGELEFAIKKQLIKIKEEKDRIKTIFKIGETVLTAVKIEKKEFIHVLTLWEASEKEVELWKKK